MYRAISPAFSLVLHFPGFPKGRERKPPGKLLVLPHNARFRGGRDPLGNPKPFDFPRKTASCDLRKFRKVQASQAARLIGRGAPADAEACRFARGQALLVAETGNLLLIRPPRSAGQDIWMDRATELRDAASRLAGVISQQDLARSRTGLLEVAAACNRCHASFRVAYRARP